MNESASTANQPVGVVLMAYGAPASRDDIEAYYTDIRRGRPPTPEALADLIARYDAIGGSPLAARTEAQRAALANALDAIAPGRYRVAIGLKHADPRIDDAVDQLADAGVGSLVGLVLAPHYSSGSIGGYLSRLSAAAERRQLPTTTITSWASEPAYIEFIAADLRRRIEHIGTRAKVLFTAHSLPERIVAGGDPYPSELRATAEAVADTLRLDEGTDWEIAWQSAGRTPEPWIGPDILETIDRIADTGDHDAVIVSAVGFVADHLEVLYDLDIEARHRAEDRGLRFDRTSCVNDDHDVIVALAHRVAAASVAVPES